MKRRLLRFVAAAVTALSLTTGVAAANSGSIDTTGPDSHNAVEFKNRHELRVKNNNNATVANSNPQTATTGDAKVRRNTTGGDAETGEAANDSLLSVSATLDNSSGTDCACNGSHNGDDEGTIDNTGPDSFNEIVFDNKSEVKIENNNNITVSNSNTQTATSGDARVTRNTTGGDATSGDASNISTTEVTLDITN